MSGDEAATETERTDVDTATEEETTDEETQTEAGATLDIEAAVEQEQTTEQLRERIEEQQGRIEELEDMVLDLTTRVADDKATGVCPDCHGPVIKHKPWFRSSKIKCMDCGRVFHEY